MPPYPSKFVWTIGIAVALGCSPIAVAQVVPAFSGADGAGATVSGGRGGVVYHVTRLDTKIGDNGVGTLQYGVSDANFKDAGGNVIPRTIVFDVGGTIWLGRNIGDTEGWDTTNSMSVGSNVTIAGQTAPGGITIAGGQIKMNGATAAAPGSVPISNSIIRNVTLAPGYGTRRANSASGYYDNYVYDAMNVNSRSVMVDHVSSFFATDETISCNEFADKTTIQYSSMSQGQNYPQADAQGGGAYKGHAMGSLWSPGSNSTTSFLHNLYAHQATRAPTFQTSTSKLSLDTNGNYIPPYIDFRNNVIYNWQGNAGYGSSGLPANANFINNYYKVGPGGDSTSGNATDFGIKTSVGGTTVFSGSASTIIYATGNSRMNLNGTTTSLTASNFGSGATQTNPNAVYFAGATDSASAAYLQVLNYVGANWQNRGFIDLRIINEVRNGTGKITALDDSANGYNSSGAYVTGTTINPDTEWSRLLARRSVTNGGTGGTGSFARAANYDTDSDGMPDIWEAAHGLNPTVADHNGSFASNGYTNLDEFINELGAFPASGPIIYGNANGTGRYAEIGNWTTGVFQPSRFDTVQINSGTVAMDAIGQHAGTLKIATNSGNTATFNVTGGWIDCSQSMQVGVAGVGTVNQSGGIVHATTSIVVGGTLAGSKYTLSGGTLSTPLLTKGTGGGTFSFTGGTLHAATVAFSLTNSGGVLSPGSDTQLQWIAAASMPDINGNFSPVESSIGSTHVQGSLTLSSGTLQIELASYASGDSIAVDATLTLGGTLEVDPLAGFNPLLSGRKWLIGSAASITGSFASITPGYATQITGGSLYVIAVPEPHTAIAGVLISGMMLLARRRRRSL